MLLYHTLAGSQTSIHQCLNCCMPHPRKAADIPMRARAGQEESAPGAGGGTGMPPRNPALRPGAPAGWEQDGAQQREAARPVADFRFAVTFTAIAAASFCRSILGDSGAGAASWADHAVLAGYGLSTALLAALAAGSTLYRRPRVRHSVIAVFRLFFFVGADRMIHRNLMDVPPRAGPAGPLVDLVHLALGETCAGLAVCCPAVRPAVGSGSSLAARPARPLDLPLPADPS